MHSYLRYASVGIEMGLSVVAGLLIGKFLDDQLGTDPWLTLVFLLFGSAAGFRALIRAARRMQRDFQSQDPPAGSGKGQDGKRKDDA
jgi:ATP synthase protein I